MIRLEDGRISTREDYQVAIAAGMDAANRRARREGRAEWNDEDYREAAAVTDQILRARAS